MSPAGGAHRCYASRAATAALVLLAVGALGVPANYSVEACVISAEAMEAASDPFLFGLNYILDGSYTKYNNTGLLDAARGLNAGALRFPGGTAANFWNLNTDMNTDSADLRTKYCPKMPSWSKCKEYEDKPQPPAGVFTPLNFVEGVEAASANPHATMWCLNLLTLSEADTLKQVDRLLADGVKVGRIEMGNEYFFKQFDWKYPTGESYMEKIQGVIGKARAAWPGVKVGVVAQGDGGQWDKGVAKHPHLFDAVTVHAYGPEKDEVAKYPKSQQASVLSTSGEAIVAGIENKLRAVFSGKQVWRTEFNYGPSYASTLPDVPGAADGAIHGMFWASHVLASVQRYGYAGNTGVFFRANFLQRFGLYARIQGESGQINGAGQIISHVSTAALGGGAFKMAMKPVSLGCNPSADFVANYKYANSERPKCLQAAAFVSSDRKSHASFVLLNSCKNMQVFLDFTHSLLVSALDDSVFDIVLTQYQSTDLGGWANVPPKPSQHPWSTGPLTPIVKRKTARGSELKSVQVWTTDAALTVATATLRE